MTIDLQDALAVTLSTHFQVESLSTLVQPVWSFLLEQFVAVAILGLLVWMADTVCTRRVWPEVRAVAWSAVLLRAVIPGSFGLSLPPMPSSPSSSSVHDVFQVADGSVLIPTDPSAAAFLQILALAVWVAGTFCLGAAGVLGYARRVRQLRRDSCAAPESVVRMAADVAQVVGLRSAPHIMVSTTAAWPLIFGLMRPCIVLPASWTDKELELEHALLHEMMHMKRGDPWRAAFAQVVAVHMWPHPMIWIALRKLHGLREMCCDLAVADRLEEATAEYRRTMISCVRAIATPPPSGFLAFAGAPNTVRERLHWLSRPMWRRRTARRIASLSCWPLFVILGVACMPARPDRSASDWRFPIQTDIAAPLDAIATGPGCLPFRFQVLQALAEQEAKSRNSDTPADRP